MYQVVVDSAISVLCPEFVHLKRHTKMQQHSFIYFLSKPFFRFILWNICIDALICLVLFSFICVCVCVFVHVCVCSCVQKYIYSRYKTILFHFCTDNMYLVEQSSVVEQVRRVCISICIWSDEKQRCKANQTLPIPLWQTL